MKKRLSIIFQRGIILAFACVLTFFMNSQAYAQNGNGVDYNEALADLPTYLFEGQAATLTVKCPEGVNALQVYVFVPGADGYPVSYIDTVISEDYTFALPSELLIQNNNVFIQCFDNSYSSYAVADAHIPVLPQPDNRVTLSVVDEGPYLVNKPIHLVVEGKDGNKIYSVSHKRQDDVNVSVDGTNTSYYGGIASFDYSITFLDGEVGKRLVCCSVLLDGEDTYITSNPIELTITSLGDTGTFDFLDSTDIEATQGDYFTVSFSESEHAAQYEVLIDERWVQVSPIKRIPSTANVVTIPTGNLYPGDYTVRVVAKGRPGYSGCEAESSINLTVNERNISGVELLIRESNVLFLQTSGVTILAEGAPYRLGLSVDGVRIDQSYSSGWNSNGGWSFTKSIVLEKTWYDKMDVGTHTLVGYAQYEDGGEWYSSEAKTITVTCLGQVSFAASDYVIPAYLVEGEEATFSVKLPENAARMNVMIYGYWGSFVGWTNSTTSYTLYSESNLTDDTVIVIPGSELNNEQSGAAFFVEVRLEAITPGYRIAYETFTIPVVTKNHQTTLSLTDGSNQVLVNGVKSFTLTNSQNKPIKEVRLKIGNQYDFHMGILCTPVSEGNSYVFQCKITDEYLGEHNACALIMYEGGGFETTNALSVNAVSLTEPEPFDFVDTTPIEVIQGGYVTFTFSEVERYSNYGVILCDEYGNRVDWSIYTADRPSFRMSTAHISPGVYYVRGYTKGTEGYVGSQSTSTVKLTVKNEGILLESFYDEVEINQSCPIVVSAPGALRIGLSIDGRRVDNHDESPWNYWNSSINSYSPTWNKVTDAGTHTLIAYAQYEENGEWIASDSITIRVTAKGKLTIDISDVPTSISAGEDVSFTITLTGGEGEMSIGLDGFEDGSSRTYTCTTGTQEIVLEGKDLKPGTLDLWCQAQAKGYESDSKSMSITVLPVGEIAFDLSDIPNVIFNDSDVSFTIRLPENAEYMELNITEYAGDNSYTRYSDYAYGDVTFSVPKEELIPGHSFSIWCRTDRTGYICREASATIIVRGAGSPDVQLSVADEGYGVGKLRINRWWNPFVLNISNSISISSIRLYIDGELVDQCSDLEEFASIPHPFYEAGNHMVWASVLPVGGDTWIESNTLSVESIVLGTVGEYSIIGDDTIAVPRGQSLQIQFTEAEHATFYCFAIYDKNGDCILWGSSEIFVPMVIVNTSWLEKGEYTISTYVNGDFGYCTRTSEATIKLTILDGIVVTSQPQDAAVEIGTSATFSVEATGEELSYLWEYKRVTDSSWKTWKAKTTARISVSYDANRDGMLLRCKITDGNGNVVRTNEVTLTYYEPVTLEITKQPQSTTVETGKAATFSVEATGDNISYLWEYKRLTDTTWKSWKSMTTATINVTYQANRDGMQLRCKISDRNGNVLRTNEVTLTYVEPVRLEITKQPQNTTVETGKAATFSVEATGDNISYLWEYKRVADTSWKSWKSMTEATIKVTYQANRDGMLLRCKITDGKGNVLRTNEVTLTYVEPVTLVITKQPQSATVATGKSATFSVEATGENLTYLWEYKRVTDTSWKTWKSKTTPTMTVPYDASRDGMQLRCKITDGQGNVIRSVEVTLNYQ